MDLLHEDQYIRPCEKRLIDENRKYWADSANGTGGKKWIYTFHTVPGLFEFVVHEGITAKRLQEEEGLPIAAISYEGCGCRLFDELDYSFGIKDLFHFYSSKSNGIVSELRTHIAAQYWARTTYGKKTELLKIKYRGIACGDILYDAITREIDNVTYDCFAGGLESYYIHIRKAFTIIDWSFNVFQKKIPAYLITAEHVCYQALVVSVASLFGAKLLLIDNMFAEYPLRVSPSIVLSNRLKMTMVLQQYITHYCKHNLVRESSFNNLFLSKMEDTSNNELCRQLGIENKKKNVFIMLHVLGDVPRESSEQRVYIGYKEWYCDTLEIISKIPGINWIVKDHPESDLYGQGDYVKSLFQKYKTDNMYWCDKAVSGLQIKEVADCVITCSGDVGIEYWAYGIPTITLSETYYTGKGISYQMNSRDEYIETLRHIEELRKPDSDSVKYARIYLAALKSQLESNDELAMLFSSIRLEQVENSKTANAEDTFSRLRYKFCKAFIGLLHNKKVKKSRVYKADGLSDYLG